MAISKYLCAAFAVVMGANGRKLSLFLIELLMWSRVCFAKGGANMERFLSARGPLSIRPWNHPMTFSLASDVAASLQMLALFVYLTFLQR